MEKISNSCALGIFVKNNILGKVKTRIAIETGDSKALEIYKDLQQITFDITKEMDARKFVFYHQYLATDDIWDSELFTKKIQSGEDLGARLTNAFQDMDQSGFAKKIIIGSDCPYINSKILADAKQHLEVSDAVIGPAEDGGYYLLGLNTINHLLFQNIPWSTDSVFKKTIEIFENNNLSYGILPTLSDIDHYSDWLKYKTH